MGNRDAALVQRKSLTGGRLHHHAALQGGAAQFTDGNNGPHREARIVRMPGHRGGSTPWLAAAPKTWPAPPNEMSVSSLGEIESCPRRWALASADYPQLWDHPGYPPRLYAASLTGSVVHLALKTVTQALARAGCRLLADADAVQVMRGLGGYTK